MKIKTLAAAILFSSTSLVAVNAMAFDLSTLITSADLMQLANNDPVVTCLMGKGGSGTFNWVDKAGFSTSGNITDKNGAKVYLQGKGKGTANASYTASFTEFFETTGGSKIWFGVGPAVAENQTVANLLALDGITKPQPITITANVSETDSGTNAHFSLAAGAGAVSTGTIVYSVSQNDTSCLLLGADHGRRGVSSTGKQLPAAGHALQARAVYLSRNK